MVALVEWDEQLSADQRVRLTIAICTFDRPKDLEQCLLSLCRQDANPNLFEVLVVDNGPNESTAAVAERFAESALPVRYVVEPRRGTTYARRTAWRSAAGELVAYVDDDAAVCPQWVSRLISAFDREPSTVAMIGGPVHNVLGLSDPLPFTDSPQNGLNLGPGPRLLDDEEMLWGCNFAFRRAAMAKVNAHGEDIGPKGKRPGANEDILVQFQLIRGGYDRLYDPSVQIVHNSWRATADDQTLDRLAFWTGFDDAQMDRILEGPDIWQRGSRIWARMGRLRAQSAAWLHARRTQSPTETRNSRRAVIRSLGTVGGMLWPPRNPGTSTDAGHRPSSQKS